MSKLKGAGIAFFAFLLFAVLPCSFACADTAAEGSPQDTGVAAPSPADNLKQISRQCDERIKLLGKNLAQKDDELKALGALLTSMESAAKKEPEAATKSAAGAPPAQVIEAAKTARESGQLYVSLADNMKAQAAKELALAEKEPDPTVKMVHYKQSLDFLDQGETLSRRAISDVPAPAASPAVPATRPLNFNLEALNQAKAMAHALEGADTQSQVGTLLKAWDGEAQQLRETTAVSGNTPFFSGEPSAYSSGVVTLGNGNKIDSSVIESAAAGSAPERQPLFKPVPAPDGGTQYTVDPSVVNRAHEAAEDPNVGGVALQIAFLSLDAAGVAGFQGGSSLDGVDHVVLISLQGLLSRLRPHAADWEALPDDVRFPGDAGRILGYVLDPLRKDVVLVATQAERPAARMDVDSLILGLRASWKEQVSPKVSLDASPADPFGAQLSRVEGIPKDSVMAKIMLEADYMMKQMMLGQRKTDVASFHPITETLKENPGQLSQPWRSRFWFYPKPLSHYSLAVSTGGRTTTFNAELQVLTEQMTTQGGTFVSSGAAGQLENTAASDFSRSIDAFAGSTDTDPEALLTRLRGISSVVTLGVLLRKAGIDYPVLKDFSGLQYRRLAEGEAAPALYPGIVTKFEHVAQNRVYLTSIGGGVSLVPRPPRGAHQSGVDGLASVLEREVDAGKLLSDGILKESVPVVLARTEGSSLSRRVDELMLRGSAAFAGGQFEEAAKVFRAAIETDPAQVDAYINLSFSLSRLGRDKEAIAAIHTARLLEPDDHTARLVEFAVRKSGEPWAGGDPAKAYRELRTLYLGNARHALYRGNDAQALAWASDAIAIDRLPTSAEAYYIRGEASLKAAPEKACSDFERARSETEYAAISGAAYDDDPRLFTLAALGLAECSVRKIGAALDTETPGPELFRASAEKLEQPIADLKSAQKLLPEFPAVSAALLHVEGVHYGFLKSEYTPESLEKEKARLAALGADIASRFPDSSQALYAVGQIYLDLEDAEQAISVCSRSLERQPLDAGCLTVRGVAYALSDKCDDARKDISAASRDSEFSGVPREFKSRCGDL
ncbi:MAG: tetratricopeptide repeat protein [Alphaproteobacteria bacterium]|nr:MAG: tetratricopeptide repeat protein [Alphaproteobacteria bacterium]